MFKYLVTFAILSSSVAIPVNAAAEKTTPMSVVDVLLKYGSGTPTVPALNAALYSGDIDAVKLLIEHGANINSRPLVGCCGYLNGYSGCPQIVVETALEVAIEMRDKELIKYLLSHGANPHLERRMQVYIIERDQKSFNQIIKYENISGFGTAVYLAIRTEDLELLSLMIGMGTDINKICRKEYVESQNEWGGLTPLQVAAKLKLKKVVEFLLSKGART